MPPVRGGRLRAAGGPLSPRIWAGGILMSGRPQHMEVLIVCRVVLLASYYGDSPVFLAPRPITIKSETLENCVVHVRKMYTRKCGIVCIGCGVPASVPVFCYSADE